MKCGWVQGFGGGLVGAVIVTYAAQLPRALAQVPPYWSLPTMELRREALPPSGEKVSTEEVNVLELLSKDVNGLKAQVDGLMSMQGETWVGIIDPLGRAAHRRYCKADGASAEPPGCSDAARSGPTISPTGSGYDLRFPGRDMRAAIVLVTPIPHGVRYAVGGEGAQIGSGEGLSTASAGAIENDLIRVVVNANTSFIYYVLLRK